jgi:hypothetical protein
MCFCYVLPRWEGSAADGRVYDNACWHSLAMPPGTYFLADARFPTCAGLIIPFKRERYHLKEWARTPERFVMSFSSYCTTCWLLVKGHKMLMSFSIYDIQEHEMLSSRFLELSNDASDWW